MKSWLSQPFPYLVSLRLRLALCFLIGLIVFLTLTIFRPFGLHEVESITYISGFGACVLISMLLHLVVLPKIKSNWFDPDHWTIGHQVLIIASIILLAAVLNFTYNSTVGYHISPQYSLPLFILKTMSVGALPTLLMVYMFERSAKKANVKWAQSIKLEPTVYDNDMIIIESEGKKEDPMIINSKDLLYARSSNNYTEVFYLKDGLPASKVLRLKIKSLESQLIDYRQFLRCHRSYILNKSAVSRYGGNARSMTAHISGINKGIPISRQIDKSLLI